MIYTSLSAKTPVLKPSIFFDCFNFGVFAVLYYNEKHTIIPVFYGSGAPDKGGDFWWRKYSNENEG
jgi:hypothetical protein